MKSNRQISLAQWNELTNHEKEILRNWAIKRGYELDVVPGSSGTFDPVCEYAIFLNKSQMIEFLKSCKISFANKENINKLWKKIKVVIK